MRRSVNDSVAHRGSDGCFGLAETRRRLRTAQEALRRAAIERHLHPPQTWVDPASLVARAEVKRLILERDRAILEAGRDAERAYEIGVGLDDFARQILEILQR